MQYRYEVTPLASQKIWAFYRNVAKKYRNTFDAEDIVKSAQKAIRNTTWHMLASGIMLIASMKTLSPLRMPVTNRICTNKKKCQMMTSLKNNSASTLVCVLMINAQGIMLSVRGQDYFLSYNRIPWMQDAPIRSVLNVQMSGPESIEWPDLDVDLEIESLRHPERYPLVIKRNALDFVRG